MQAFDVSLAQLVVRKLRPLVQDVGIDAEKRPPYAVALDVLEVDVLHEPAPAPVGLDEHEVVGGLYRAMVHPDVADSARKLGANAQQGVRKREVAVADDHVLGRAVQPPCVLVAPRLEDDPVVALVEPAVLDENVPRHLDVNAVVVMSVRARIEIADYAVFAMVEVNRPERRLADTESVQKYVPAAVELHEVRTHVRPLDCRDVARSHGRIRRAPVVKALRRVHVLGRALEPRPPEVHARRNSPLAGYGDVRHAVCVQERREVHALHSLPRRMHGGKVVGGVVRELKRRAFVKMQIAVAAEMHRAREPLALRHDHASAAGLFAFRHRRRESIRRLHAFPGAEVGYGKIPVREFRHRNRRHLERRV